MSHAPSIPSSVPSELRCRDKRLALHVPRVMGVLNVTPDSFSDGGRHWRDGCVDLDAAIESAGAMIEAGATIIDVGGESTRPGADGIELGEELRRVIPIVERLARMSTIVSVDTSKPAVARAALDAGADLINDVRAVADPELRQLIANCGAGVCLMHMQGEPSTMQASPRYRNVVSEVSDYLLQRARACEAAGIEPERVCIDPGFGFGKTLEHNLELLRHLGRIAELGYPLVVGLSRKGMIGALTGRPVNERTAGSIAAAIVAVQNGATIVRTHDVAATVDALNVVARVTEN